MNEEVQCVIFRRMYEQAAQRIPTMQISSGCPVTNLVRVLILFALPVLVSAQTSNHSIVYQGVQRNYTVFLPRTYAPHGPVLMDLHGYGENGQAEMSYTGTNSIADTAGFLAVYPDAIGGVWNSGINDEPSIPAPSSDDVGFISALIDSLDAEYRIDLRRVYVCGYSNGGFMCHKLAGELSSRISAVASVSGVIANSTASNSHPEHPVPILSMHGTADPIIPYAGTPHFHSAEQTVQHWVSRDSCTNQPDTVNLPDSDPGDGCTVQRISYTNRSGNPEVVFYKVINGGHCWPGASSNPFLGNTNGDINAGVEIWAFVRNTRLPSTLTVSVRSIDFENVPVHTVDTIALSVRNISSVPLTVGIFHTRDEYELLTMPSNPVTLDPFSSLRLGVVFRPSSQGAVDDTITISDTLQTRLQVALHGNGITTAVHIITRDNLSSAPELMQNYPNPFNPSTTIGFRIQASGFTTLKVYDLLGREVQTLVAGELGPGMYQAAFDRQHLASGVYFYQLRTGRSTLMKTLLILR